jgi:hypothetical protein
MHCCRGHWHAPALSIKIKRSAWLRRLMCGHIMMGVVAHISYLYFAISYRYVRFSIIVCCVLAAIDWSDSLWITLLSQHNICIFGGLRPVCILPTVSSVMRVYCLRASRAGTMLDNITSQVGEEFFSRNSSGYELCLDWLEPFDSVAYSVGVLGIRSSDIPDDTKNRLEFTEILAIIPGPRQPPCLRPYLLRTLDAFK